MLNCLVCGQRPLSGFLIIMHVYVPDWGFKLCLVVYKFVPFFFYIFVQDAYEIQTNIEN